MLPTTQWRFSLLLGALLSLGQVAHADRRVALVMGNGAYLHVRRLSNPPKDASAVADKLKNLGFHVEMVIDQPRIGMEAAIRRFNRQLDGTDIALFFYAGHGLQVGGRNYIVPVDAKLEHEDDLDYEMMEMGRLLEPIEEKARAGIVILDACRDNPLANNLRSTTRSLGRGLTVIHSKKADMLVVFATAPGDVAEDGVGQHSPFTSALLANIDQRVEVETMLKQVTLQVQKQTQGRQRPWRNASLMSNIYLAGETASIAPNCPAGTHRQDGACVPDVRIECPVGFAFQVGQGCVPVILNGGAAPLREKDVVGGETAASRPPIRPLPALNSSPDASPVERNRPGLTAGDAFWGATRTLSTVTDAQIKVLQRLIEVTIESDPEKPDLLFRMAEIYAQQQYEFDFKTRELDDKITKAQMENRDDETRLLKTKQQDFERRSNVWLLEAVKKHFEVATGPKYQTYKKMDQVLFNLAYLLTKAKREDEARVYSDRLIKDYSTSPYLAHYYLAFGEYFFESSDFDNALIFYEKSLSFKNSKVYGHALYQKGWAHSRKTEFKAALQDFAEVVKFTAKRDDKTGLAQEARNDLVRTYAQVGDAGKAYSFFKKFGSSEAKDMMEQLSVRYQLQGKLAESAKVQGELRLRVKAAK